MFKTAVSYTHLDVYKRQIRHQLIIQDMTTGGLRVLRFCSKPDSHHTHSTRNWNPYFNIWRSHFCWLPCVSLVVDWQARCLYTDTKHCLLNSFSEIKKIEMLFKPNTKHFRFEEAWLFHT